MSEQTKVLVVEDTISLQMVFINWLRNAGFDADGVETGTEALDKIRSGAYPITLLDLQLPDMNGFEILNVVREEQIPTAIVVITSQGSINTAVEAMRAGGYDFLVKPLAEDRLITTVHNALERQELQAVVAEIRRSTDDIRRHGFIGESKPMLGVYKTVEALACSSVPVFITGESGTGKEVCANAIHLAGSRQKKPFVAVNCAAIPKDLLESEIFGHVRGAFSGATENRLGAARSADGGTLFLDEICELDASLQSKLLRFLQSKTFQPVGSDKEIEVDVRIICATNRDPRKEVAEGRFREDLFYRLHVVPLNMPPLRQRGADIIDMALEFLRRYSSEEGKKFEKFSPEAENLLLAQQWPGNVRELQNVIRQLVALNDAEVVTPDMLRIDGTCHVEGSPPAAIGKEPTWHAQNVSTDQSNTQLTLNLMASFEENERRLIEAVIARCDGSIPKAARSLDISPSTIYRKRESWSKTAV